MNIITIGYLTEGSTDKRFLEGIIRRTFEDVALRCESEIEVYEPFYINVSKSDFKSEVLEAAKIAYESGLMVVCIHTDADNPDNNWVVENKISPSFKAVHAYEEEETCKNLVPILPVYMTEAWLLSDKEKLKEEIGCTKSDQEVGLNIQPESITDPKQKLQEVIRITLEELPKRRRNAISISDLYQPLGQKISLEKLKELNSYIHFYNEVLNAFKRQNYIY